MKREDVENAESSSISKLQGFQELIANISRYQLVGDFFNTRATCRFIRSSLQDELPRMINQMKPKSICFGMGCAFILNENHQLSILCYDKEEMGNYGWPEISLESSNKPQKIPMLSGTCQMAVGVGHALFLKQDGTVYGWGNNETGQLGLGQEITQCDYPTCIPGLTNVIQISTSNASSLFLKEDGTVWATGDNRDNQLGISHISHETFEPIQIPGLNNIIQVEATDGHSFFLNREGEVLGCGYDLRGELGLASERHYFTPTKIPNLSNIKQISAQKTHCFFLTHDGKVLAWGRNERGQLGTGNSHYYQNVVELPGLPKIAKVISGPTHTLFIDEEGGVWACGDNSYGKLGMSGLPLMPTPVKIINFCDLESASLGENLTVFFKADGSSYASGNMESLGQPEHYAKPTPLKLLNQWQAAYSSFTKQPEEQEDRNNPGQTR
jgi:alpha-tubulin suppressor-like RCC1 family protein